MLWDFTHSVPFDLNLGHSKLIYDPFGLWKYLSRNHKILSAFSFISGTGHVMSPTFTLAMVAIMGGLSVDYTILIVCNF